MVRTAAADAIKPRLPGGVFLGLQAQYPLDTRRSKGGYFHAAATKVIFRAAKDMDLFQHISPGGSNFMQL